MFELRVCESASCKSTKDLERSLQQIALTTTSKFNFETTKDFWRFL